MNTQSADELTLQVNAEIKVSALWQGPPDAKACLVLAHGAGAGMRHRFMTDVAAQLTAQGIATLRYQFPYMERGSKRTDPPKLCHATVRAAVTEAARRSSVPLFAGGRSFGGRMTSQAQAIEPLPGVRGLAFLGFPLHPAKKPSIERAEHLCEIEIPMLFLQGTRDELAQMDLLEPLTRKLGQHVTLKLFEGADHSFHVPARSGRTDAMILADLVTELVQWMGRLAA